MKPKRIADQSYFADDAPWKDAQWFAQRPERQYRLRPMHPSEFDSFGGCTHILVQKISTRERQRVPMTLLAVPANIKARLQSDLPVAPDTDAVLAEIFISVLTGRRFELRSVVQDGLEKFRKTSQAWNPSAGR